MRSGARSPCTARPAPRTRPGRPPASSLPPRRRPWNLLPIRGVWGDEMRLLTILALAATLAGCTATATTASPRPSTPSSPPAFPSPVPRSIQCDGQEPVGAIGAADWPQTRDDVALGPMRWPNLKAMATGDPHNWGYRDAAGFHFKTGVELTAGATVTVTVAPEARGQAGLEDGVR